MAIARTRPLAGPAPHPGEMLKDELEARGLSPHALAIALRLPASRISQIVRGRRAITPETALRLARYFGGSAAIWLRLQVAYDLARAEDDRERTNRRPRQKPEHPRYPERRKVCRRLETRALHFPSRRQTQKGTPAA